MKIRTHEYRSWSGARNRCNNPNNPKLDNYGGRDIKVCERWNSFENFLKDMGLKPGPDYSLDRKDNNGDYELGNCQWATPAQQAQNQRAKPSQRYFLAIDSENNKYLSNNQSAFSCFYGLSCNFISHCLHGKRKDLEGWTFQWI